ncbi:hypothetical protein [Acidianus manzaensis]|uniref:Brix domain-containing protein n=1 Tax=Acidianus manzaensis TaxID=282676 RepID=A0A1W6K127_9CREN|nr:hypothetical protein [Acidianus manzaensis]ARM76197.1 hypothetical protein B6F84_09295 [Acidianus manzaensis]
MEEEKIARLLINLFPPQEKENLNIFVHKNEFIVINADLSNKKIRKYKGKVIKSKIVFSSERGPQLSINTRHIKNTLMPNKIGEFKEYSVWTSSNNKEPFILPLYELVKE